MLPPTLEPFAKAEPGDYTMRETGEVVSNPDLLCTWTITELGGSRADTGGDIVHAQLSDAEWVDLYEERRDDYKAFAKRFQNLLDTLLEEEGLYPWVITFSVDGWGMLSEAIVEARRAGQVFDNPLESHVRVAGVEVGLGAPEQAAEIEEVIEREFVVDPAASLMLGEVTAPGELSSRTNDSDTLAYEYPYYLISLDERRLELPEWSRFAGLKLRIEVKTELQDAWENVVESLPFRAAAEYPSEVRELLTGAARATSEADTAVEEARHLISRLLAEWEEAVAAGDVDLPLDGVSLLAYLRASELLRSLCEVGRDSGLRYDADHEPDWHNVARSLWLLRGSNVRTLAELDDFLTQATPRAQDVLTELARVAGDRGFVPWAFPEAIVEWLWLVLHRADAETVALVWYADELEYALNVLIGESGAAERPDCVNGHG